MKDFVYRVYGLNIESEIELPELISNHNCEPNAWIKIGKVPEHIPNITGSGPFYEMSPNDFLLRIKNIAKYRVQYGKSITVEAHERADPDEIRLFLLGSTIGALLHQRGMLTLHGSSISVKEKGITIIGSSAAGKSTLAAGLYAKGYSVIADDVSVIEHKKEHHYIYPGIPHLKLWKDVLIHLNYHEILKKVRPQYEKYKKPVFSMQKQECILLDRILFLSTNESNSYYYEEVYGSDKFNILLSNTYRIHYVAKMNMTSIHFMNLSNLAKTIRLFKIERPSSPLKLIEFVEFIENKIFSI
ncbi:MAG: hypothetical protein JW973_10100 [Bacteroidales bacterium]|nr:hypothetical protein [Bacteroidales bacterium]